MKNPPGQARDPGRPHPEARKNNRDDDPNMNKDDREWEMRRQMAAVVTEGHDAKDTPVPQLLALLNAQFAATSRVVRGYEAKAKPGKPGHYEIIQFARKKKKVDDDYTHRNNTGILGKVDGLIKRIPARFKMRYMCREFAGALKTSMKKAGIEGDHILIKNVSGQFIESKSHGIIGKSGFHEGILVGDKVFDNMNSNGIDYLDWINDIGIPENHANGSQYMKYLPW